MTQRSFLYSDVASEIRSRIVKGSFAPGSRLPSLSEFVDRFGVSAITIRRALGELTHEGLIEGHQGLGVFVKPARRIHRVLAGDPNNTMGDEIARAGFTPRLAEIGFGQIKATHDIASRLKVRAGSNISRHQSVTYADEEPVALHTIYMSPKVGRVLRDDLSHSFVFKVLQDHRLATDGLKCGFSAVPLGEQQARIFGMPAGQPMLRVDYTHLDKHGAAMVIGQTICRADRFVFEVNLPRGTGRAAGRKS